MRGGQRLTGSRPIGQDARPSDAMTTGSRYPLGPIVLLTAAALSTARWAQAQVDRDVDAVRQAGTGTDPGVDPPCGGTEPPPQGSRSPAAGQYVDTAGAVRDFDVEYARQLETRPAHQVRTWTMMAGGLTALSLGHWLGMDRQVADWDNPRPQQRFDGTAWRTDNNALSVKHILHPMAGGLAYSFARANHHAVAGSAAYVVLPRRLPVGRHSRRSRLRP
jgi:hypothetical protein